MSFPYQQCFKMFLLCSLSFIYGCDVKTDCDETPDDSDCITDSATQRPAYTILQDFGGLHQFNISAFTQDQSDSSQDVMKLQISNYGLATDNNPSNSELEDNPSINRLALDYDIWEEVSRRWLNNETLDIEGSDYQKIKTYYLPSGGNLGALINNSYNQPIYTADNKDVREQQQGSQFYWDFGDYEIEGLFSLKARISNLAGKYIRNYASHPDNIDTPLLEKANIWGQDVKFSEGAVIYGGSRSVANDKLIIESVLNNNSFSMAEVNFTSGHNSIAEALAPWPTNGNASNHLSIKYSVGFLNHFEVKAQFDPATQTAQLFTNNNADLTICVPNDPDNKVCDRIEVSYTENNSEKTIELELMDLSASRLRSLNLPGYFNLIIAGPFNNAQDFYYGKHYKKTTTANRIKLSPQFWLNPIAAEDVRSAFKAWRQEVFDDR